MKVKFRIRPEFEYQLYHFLSVGKLLFFFSINRCICKIKLHVKMVVRIVPTTDYVVNKFWL